MNTMRRALLVLPLLLLFPMLMLPAGARADEYASGEVIVRLITGADIDAFNLRWGTTTLDCYAEGNLYLLHAEGDQGMDDLSGQMMSDPDVVWAEPNYIQDTPEGLRQMVINAIGGDYVDYEDQEISARIGLPEAHQISLGAGVRVAILDTGVDPDHEALSGHLAPEGWDFVGGDAEPWEEADSLDEDGDGMIDEGFAHGTMVAGIVALVAPAAEILPVRVLDDEGRADAFRIVEGMDYALTHGARVINCSFGTEGTIEAIDLMIELARSQGVAVIAAAGNRAMENPALFPACQDDAYMITALDSLDCKADFADWNERVMVSAPGTGVRSAYPGNDWGLGSGCSFAAPFVTGEVALIRSRWPDLILGGVEERVSDGVQDIYNIPENDPYLEKLGTGRIYLPGALTEDQAAAPISAPGARTGVARAWPNPSTAGVRLSLPDAAPGALRLSVFDPSGRLIARSSLPDASAAAWDGRDARGALVPAGRYQLLLEQGGRSFHGSVMIVR